MQEEIKCPFLPQSLWTEVTRHALTAAAAGEGGAGHRAMLRQCATLLLVSRHIAAAVREAQLCLDLRAAPEEDLLLLPPLAATVPLRQLQLAPRHASGAEALLRCAAVSAASAASLNLLAATVACTDTLQRYPRLSELHLHAGVLERLYPAVLHGLPTLRQLGLHGYQEVQLAQLPPSVASTLQVLEVTPRPEAMRCQLSIQLPAAMRLLRLAVHGSFLKVLSSKAAPLVYLDACGLPRQCESVRIEAQEVVWQLPPSCHHGREVERQPEAALASCLLHAEAAWSRLELHILEGVVAVEVPTVAGVGSMPASRFCLDLGRLAEVMEWLGDGCVHASLRQESCSIFHPWVLVLARWRPGQGCAYDDATTATAGCEAAQRH